MNRPIEFPNWTDGSPSKVVSPPGSFRLEGWDPGQAPPSQYMNWLFWLINQWLMYFDTITNAGVPDQSIRLINGGEWSFVASSNLFAWSADANISMPGLPDADNRIPAGSVTLNDGQIAYVAANTSAFSKGSTQSGLNQIFNMNFTGDLTIGMSVSGPGIPGGTLITGVFADSVAINNNALSNQTDQTYIFGNTGTLSVVVVDNTAFVPQLNSLVIARRSGKKIYVGLNGTEMTLLDGEFKPLSETGYLQTYAPTAGESLSAGQAVYISPGGGGDGGRTAGRAYLLDCSATNAQRSNFAGFVTSDALAGNPVQLTFSGFFSGTGLTIGSIYYGDPSIPGAITAIRPSGNPQPSVMPVGIAISATELLLTNAEGIPAAPQNQGVLKDEVLGFGPQSSFTLSQTPYNASSVMIFVNRQKLQNSLVNVSGVTVTFVGGYTVPVGAIVEAQYVLSSAFNLSLIQESAPTTTNRQTFTLQGNPINNSSVFLFVDRAKLDLSKFSLTQSGGQTTLTILAGPLAPGQIIEICYFTAVSSGGGTGGGISGGTNLGSGAAVFAGIAGSNAQFKTIVPFDGSVSITQDSDQVYIKSNGGGSSYTRNVFGSFSAPILITPSVGIVPSADLDQTWWVKPNVSGAHAITSTPQIAAGTTVGQRLTLKGVSSSDYLTIADGNGTSQNGLLNLDNNQAICYEWDGSTWSEDFRRF